MKKLKEWLKKRKQPTVNAEDILRLREGYNNRVYKDTLDNLTVGIGHLVRPDEQYEEGMKLPDSLIESMFKEDVARARVHAVYQAKMLKIRNKDFIESLVVVNFQLGGNWWKIHKNTWAYLKARKYREAADEVKRSLWFRQTPVRVEDFRLAILKLDRGKWRRK